jgi:hypothetical protein
VVPRPEQPRTGGARPDDAPLVRYQLHGKVAVLTINRPERHNAWTFAVEKELFGRGGQDSSGSGVARQAEQALGDDVQVDLLRAAVDRLGAAQQVGAL